MLHFLNYNTFCGSSNLYFDTFFKFVNKNVNYYSSNSLVYNKFSKTIIALVFDIFPLFLKLKFKKNGL